MITAFQAFDQVLGREAELISALAPEQRAALTELLRVLLNDLDERLGPPSHTQVGFEEFRRVRSRVRAVGVV